jgi:small subunit ribosomal protein S20
MRSSARRHTQNRAVKSRLKNLEKSYRGLVAAGKKDEAATALKQVSAAFDKAAKTGVIHGAAANRKKSRLATRLAKAK